MQNTLEISSGNRLSDVGPDTGVVLFLLTVEYGRAVSLLSVEGVLTAITVLMVAVLPYFLPSNRSDLTLGEWLAGRGVVCFVGLLVGSAVQVSGISATIGSLPMTFLILAGMSSCYLQFYGLMKLRLAK